MATTTANPLSLDEMRDILVTIQAAQQEIIKPGSAANGGYARDLDDDINDALYRLTDAIERAQRLEAEAA